MQMTALISVESCAQNTKALGYIYIFSLCDARLVIINESEDQVGRRVRIASFRPRPVQTNNQILLYTHSLSRAFSRCFPDLEPRRGEENKECIKKVNTARDSTRNQFVRAISTLARRSPNLSLCVFPGAAHAF